MAHRLADVDALYWHCIIDDQMASPQDSSGKREGVAVAVLTAADKMCLSVMLSWHVILRFVFGPWSKPASGWV